MMIVMIVMKVLKKNYFNPYSTATMSIYMVFQNIYHLDLINHCIY
jgi:hypothetical protein